VRAGDVDLDGFPDLLFIRADGTKPRNREYTPTLLMNVACGEKNAVGCEKGGRRAWKIVKKGADALENIKDARGVAFIDVDEDGTLDILVQRTGKEKLSFVQNNFYHDAFFLKAIGKAWIFKDGISYADSRSSVLNSACPGGWCTAPNGSTYHVCGYILLFRTSI
jgi:integrin alpha FG-GAP repeat containing protein 1